MATTAPPRLARAASCLLLLAALAAALIGCSRSAENKGGGEAAAARVKLALNWVAEPEFGGFYAAREGGAFKRAGLDVEIMNGAPGVPVVQMVASGQVEFGIVGGDDVVIARTRGADVLPIFAVYQISPHAIMAHASRGAKGIADVLQGGTLAVEPGAPYVAYLKKKYGFDKVNIVPYDGGVARFVVDKDFAQQCFITSEPIAAKQKGAEPQVFLIADEGYTPYNAVVITRKALWKEKPDQVRAFARAAREGWRAYLDDPAQVNAVMGNLNTTMDAETFRLGAQAQVRLIDDEPGKKLGRMTRARWEALGKQLVELGIIKEAPPADDYLIAIDDG